MTFILIDGDLFKGDHYNSPKTQFLFVTSDIINIHYRKNICMFNFKIEK